MTIPHKPLALAAAALVAAALAGTAGAEPMAATGGYNTEFQKMGMMQKLDGNGDHKVTGAEFEQYFTRVFDELDSNRDGTLTVKEWVGTQGKQDIALATGGYSRELRKTATMDAIDADADHQVTRSEFLSYQKGVFAKMDSNADAALDPQEWLAKQTGN